MVHPEGGRAAGRSAHPRPQQRAAGLPQVGRAAVPAAAAPRVSCVTTITLSFLSNQHDVFYLPIEYSKRAGKSKFSFISDAYRYILQVLRMVMYFNPLKVLMPPALWLVGIGLVKGVVDIVRYGFYLTSNTIVIFLSGLLIGSLALLADLIVRSRSE